MPIEAVDWAIRKAAAGNINSSELLNPDYLGLPMNPVEPALPLMQPDYEIGNKYPDPPIVDP
ncbi:MAG: hypothetical protein R3A13_03120 [Bdellovibrionota bacterium]